MKKIILFFMILNLIFPSAVYAQAVVEEKIIHVAPTGNDSNAGTEEAPLRTLKGARKKVDKIRNIRYGSGFFGPVTVLFHGGVYPMEERVHFWNGTYYQYDSGFPDGKTVYKAAGDGEVIFRGSKDLDLNDFVSVSDDEILNRLPVQSRNKVLEIDLQPYGITAEMLTMTDDKYNTANETDTGVSPLGIFYNGKRQQMACWPNDDFSYMKNIIRDTDNNEVSFEYEGDVSPEKWTNLSEAYIGGYMSVDYTGFVRSIDRVDIQNNRIYSKSMDIAEEYNDEYRRYKVLNLLEELDCAGEYYVDRNNLKLYYYPPAGFDKAKDRFSVSVLKDVMIQLNDVDYVEFEGITFSECYGHGIITHNSNYMAFRNCTFHDLAFTGLQLTSNNITIENCDFYNLGPNAIYLSQYGFDYETLAESNNIVRNNHVYNVAEGVYAGNGAIWIRGNKTLVENNTVHSGVYAGLVYSGTDNIFRHNELYNLGTQAGDAGAIYTGRSWIDYGNVIEENYIHTLGYWGKRGYIGINGIFLDDTASGNIVKNNIIINKTKGYGILGASGRDNTITGNIVIGASSVALSFSDYMNDYTYEEVIERGKACGLYDEAGNLRSNIGGITSKYSKILDTYNSIKDNEHYYPDGLEVKNNAFGRVITRIQRPDVYLRNGNSNVFSNNKAYPIKCFKNNYLLSSENAPSGFLLNDSYDMDNIGIQRTFVLGDFSKTMPYNNETVIWSDKAVLSWEQSKYADSYTYTVATDSEFKNIVKHGKTNYLKVEINDLQPDTLYYWKVSSNSGSFKNEISSVCSDGVATFRTAQ